MNPSIASLICACGIAGLFYLDRDDSVRTSKALWLPVVYLWIIGSRPFSFWLGVAPSNGANVQLDGSPVDALFFGLLLAAAVVVLIRRGKRTRTLITANWPILIYFLYCLVSVGWSYHPDVALKRWIKAIGDLAMVLIVVTDGQPVAALRRLFSRVGFLLLPTSVLFIKYYGNLGRGYTPDGAPMNTGVTDNKNSLGLIVFLLSLGTLWHFLALLRAKEQPHRSRHLVAQGILLAFGISLLGMADSATSLVCFILGSVLMLLAQLPLISRRPGRIHAFVAVLLLVGVFAMLFGGQSGVTHALGRQANFSGRTEIWTDVIAAVPNPIVGAGFESFWISPCVEKVYQAMTSWWDPRGLNEAHNGYIEVYANLGWVGLGLIVFVLIGGYVRAAAAFFRNPPVGSLLLAYVVTAVVYSATEAGFRYLIPMWIFLLLSIVGASAVSAGYFDAATRQILTPRSTAPHEMSTGKGLKYPGPRYANYSPVAR